MTKPTQRAGGIVSPSTTTPMANWMIGVRYCNRPIIVRGNRLAAAPKSSSGIAVITPVPRSSTLVRVVVWPRTRDPVTCRCASQASAKGEATAVSIVRLAKGSAPTSFLMVP